MGRRALRCAIKTGTSHVGHDCLAVLDDAAIGVATSVVPKLISLADPVSGWITAKGGLAFFA